MTLTVTAAELVITQPNSDTYSHVVPNADILSTSVGGEAGSRVADGELQLESPNGRYTTGDRAIDADDHVQLWVTTETLPVESAFGAQPFTVGPFGGGPETLVGEAIVTDTTLNGPKHNATLSATLESFAGNRLREQDVQHSEVGLPIATGDDEHPGHLDRILAEFAPDVDRDRISAVPVTIDYAKRSTAVQKAVSDLAKHAQAQTGTPVITAARNGSLLFEPLDERELAVEETLTIGGPTADIAADIETATTPPTANEVRIEGGIDDTNLVDDRQESVAQYETVTSETRKQYRVSVRKEQLSRIEIYTRALGDSEATLRVRLQASKDGAPVAPGDTDSDIISETLDVVPSDDGDWQTVRLGDHTLPPAGNPWLLVEASGDDGIQVGVDAGGTVAFRAYFPKPVIVSEPDVQSQSRFRVHDKTVTDDGLVSYAAADERAKAELAANADQRVEISGSALSPRAHALRAGDLVRFNEPWARAEGIHVVESRSATYSGPTVETDLTFVGIDQF